MTDTQQAGTTAFPLDGFEEGDEIAVSDRSTTMTVESVTERDDGNRSIIASNRYGQYTLKGYPDGSISLWVSNQFDSMVEVEHVK